MDLFMVVTQFDYVKLRYHHEKISMYNFNVGITWYGIVVTIAHFKILQAKLQTNLLLKYDHNRVCMYVLND